MRRLMLTTWPFKKRHVRADQVTGLPRPVTAGAVARLESGIVFARDTVMVSIHLRIRTVSDEEYCLRARVHFAAVLAPVAMESTVLYGQVSQSLRIIVCAKLLIELISDN